MHTAGLSFRHYIVAALFLLGAITLIGLTLTVAFDNGISEQQAQRIAEGMTKSQVIELLGEPHGRHNPDPENQWYYYCNFPTFQSDPLHIGFDETGHVNAVSR